MIYYRKTSNPFRIPSRAGGNLSGQAALGLVFLVGGIVILLGVSLAFLSFSFINSSFGFQAAQKAYALANGGAMDAVVQIDRNKDYAASSTIPLGSDTVSVRVVRDVPAAGLVTVTSQATVSFYTRKIQVVLSVDPVTGETSLISWKQLLF